MTNTKSCKLGLIAFFTVLLIIISTSQLMAGNTSSPDDGTANNSFLLAADNSNQEECDKILTRNEQFVQGVIGHYKNFLSKESAFKKSFGTFYKNLTRYRNLVKSGDMDAAKSAAVKVDLSYQRIREIRNSAKRLLPVGKRTALAFCDMVAEANAKKCGVGSVAGCRAESREGWDNLSEKGFIRTTKFDQDWRQPQDRIDGAAENITRGEVLVVKGRAFIERGIRTLPANIGSPLLEGDKLNVEAGSQASIELLGIGRLTITEMTSYQIRAREAGTPEQSLLDDLWDVTKDAIEGNTFELKNNSSTGGVRG